MAGWGRVVVVVGVYLSNRLRFRGEKQERAIQQNSCTLWAEHIRQGRGVKKRKKRKKEKKEAVSEAFTCWSRFSARRCVLSETIKATADSSGVKRSSSNPPTTAATTLHFCCPCEISLDGFNDLWMSAFSVTLTLVADTSGWQGVMHCVEALLRCNF